jgi:acetolactate synthase I/II/III large subunit
MRAADGIVDSLKAHGVKRVYCVPGESFLTLLDALHHSGIDVIVCRHESGAGFMAAAEAKLTGIPGVCIVSRGPGATNASIAIHLAEQDAVPLILIVGQVSRDERMRGAFQEVDYEHFFGSMAKGVFEITDARRIHDMMPRIFRLTAEGTPGPVILSVPEDMLEDAIDDGEAIVFPPSRLSHSSHDAALILDLIDRSARPIVMAGSGFRGAQRADTLARFAEALRIPVAATWKNQDVFDNTSNLYAGHVGFGAAASYRTLLAEADLIIAAGTRLGDIASMNYALPRAPAGDQTLIHIYPDGKPLNKNAKADIALAADPVALLRDLSNKARVVSAAREAWITKVSGFVQATREFRSVNPTDGVDFGAVINILGRLAPPNAILTTDSGNGPTWMHRHWPFTPKNTLLGAIAGSMGFGVPAAIAAQLCEPDRMAICIIGDGGILMTGQELATAIAYGAKPKIVLSDNGSYGTIRLYQERTFPGRISGTGLVNPDFTMWAKSFGADAFTIGRGDEIEPIAKDFLASPNAAVLHVKSSMQALSANVQLESPTSG